MPENDFGHEHLNQVDRNANEHWKKCVTDCIRLLAHDPNITEFSADDVHDMMDRVYPTATTHEPKAMGPRFLEAKKLGWITDSNTVVRSHREVAHGRKLTVWYALA